MSHKWCLPLDVVSQVPKWGALQEGKGGGHEGQIRQADASACFIKNQQAQMAAFKWLRAQPPGTLPGPWAASYGGAPGRATKYQTLPNIRIKGHKFMLITPPTSLSSLIFTKSFAPLWVRCPTQR